MQRHNSPHRHTLRRLLIGVLTLGLLAAACGTGNDTAAGTDPTPPPPTTQPGPIVTPAPTGNDGTEDGTTTVTDPAQPPTTEPDHTPTPPPTDEGGGWLGGEPDWYAAHEDYGEPAYAEAPPPPAAAEAPPPPAAPDLDVAMEEDMADGYEAADVATAASVPIEPEQRELTGGSIDDNEHFDEYLAYRERILGRGVRVRDLDPTGRIVVTVTGEGGLPAAGAEVVVAVGDVEVRLRTTADGTVRFHPEAHQAADGSFTVTVGGISIEVARGGSVTVETDLPTAGDGAVALDVLFLLDATGSMADEIDRLKDSIAEVAHRIDGLPGDLDARLAMTLYRDEGDSFLTATFDFTSDVDRFARALAVVVADGGGDYPEALDEALADALAKPSWRPAEQTIQLIFLVADAPPQIHRTVPTPYTASMIEAAARGIKILPVSSSGTDDQAEYVFRQLAQFTGGRYVFLTYGAGGLATGDATDIAQRDYEELSLDDLIVRLVTEELSALTGERDPR